MRENATFDENGSTDTAIWEELLYRAAQEVFEMIIGVSLRPCVVGPVREAGEFAAVIGLAGPIHGVFTIRCGEKAAIGIARGMLGVDEVAARGEVWDALGEVCNMIIGDFKGKAGRAGEMSVLSVPTVIHGRDYRVRPLIDGSCLECQMESADGVLQLRLDYRLT